MTVIQFYAAHRFGAKTGIFFEAKLQCSVRFKGPKIVRIRRPTDRPTRPPVERPSNYRFGFIFFRYFFGGGQSDDTIKLSEWGLRKHPGAKFPQSVFPVRRLGAL